jgi:hypothetical protein
VNTRERQGGVLYLHEQTPGLPLSSRSVDRARSTVLWTRSWNRTARSTREIDPELTWIGATKRGYSAIV